ncbi:hypothetical protein [Desulfitobacterium chlororespirans]|uniref:Uncharacterized protein n=1 Tax=Desulfitobacterium chlororespirans DSM 11544 TaxID=1121395 RepID=A0A1M7UJU9_9FIRM|nr:hypothetical protein [Desulfitobacterium chlororespirans]SHN83200.1 hypothetical protein SAMN02745215_03976 [Desulfitobacterium chlororespirans DSM 11544]
MDKRIMESVKEFYKNVKGQDFFLDLSPYPVNLPEEQESNYRN